MLRIIVFTCLLFVAQPWPLPARADTGPALRAGVSGGQAGMPAAPPARSERTRTDGFRQVEDAGHWTGRPPRDTAETAKPDAALRPQAASVSYIVMDQPLEAVVAELGRLAGYAPNVSREVRGRVAAGRLSGKPEALLDDLRRQHGLVTMRDGGRLHVATEAESIMRVMRTGSEPASRIREVLRTLSVDDLPRRVIVDETAGLVQINAPPMIAERIETLLANASRSSAPDSTGGITLIRFGRRSPGD
jgi:hypothetical protein